MYNNLKHNQEWKSHCTAQTPSVVLNAIFCLPCNNEYTKQTRQKMIIDY